MMDDGFMSSTPDPQRDTGSSGHQVGTEERLAAVEARVEALENAASEPSEANGFWVVDTLHKQRDQLPEGSVIFGGDLDAAGGHYSYQWQRPIEVLTDADQWAYSFERLSALAHPIRGAILRRLLQSSAQVSDLIAEDLVTSTSTAYHHLHALYRSWLIKGCWSGDDDIAPTRVIPLMKIISDSDDQ